MNIVKRCFMALLFACTVGQAGLSYASAPTETLSVTVDALIETMGNGELDSEGKRQRVYDLIDNAVDMQATAQRVVGPAWKKAETEAKKEFIELFKQVLVNTYFSLLEGYSDERVEYLEETIKKERYATVKTNIIQGDKKIPVDYRMLLRDEWKIYDMSPEGISMVRSYSSDYKSVIKRDGLPGLNTALSEKLAKQAEQPQ